MKKILKNTIIALASLYAINATAQEAPIETTTTNEMDIVSNTNYVTIYVTNYVTERVVTSIPVSITNKIPTNAVFTIKAAVDINTRIVNGTVSSTTNYVALPVILELWQVDYLFSVWDANGYKIEDPAGNRVSITGNMFKEMVIYRLDDSTGNPRFRLSIRQ